MSTQSSKSGGRFSLDNAPGTTGIAGPSITGLREKLDEILEVHRSHFASLNLVSQEREDLGRCFKNLKESVDQLLNTAEQNVNAPSLELLKRALDHDVNRCMDQVGKADAVERQTLADVDRMEAATEDLNQVVRRLEAGYPTMSKKADLSSPKSSAGIPKTIEQSEQWEKGLNPREVAYRNRVGDVRIYWERLEDIKDEHEEEVAARASEQESGQRDPAWELGIADDDKFETDFQQALAQATELYERAVEATNIAYHECDLAGVVVPAMSQDGAFARAGEGMYRIEKRPVEPVKRNITTEAVPVPTDVTRAALGGLDSPSGSPSTAKLPARSDPRPLPVPSRLPSERQYTQSRKPAPSWQYSKTIGQYYYIDENTNELVTRDDLRRRLTLAATSPVAARGEVSKSSGLPARSGIAARRDQSPTSSSPRQTYPQYSYGAEPQQLGMSSISYPHPIRSYAEAVNLPASARRSNIVDAPRGAPRMLHEVFVGYEPGRDPRQLSGLALRSGETLRAPIAARESLTDGQREALRAHAMSAADPADQLTRRKGSSRGSDSGPSLYIAPQYQDLFTRARKQAIDAGRSPNEAESAAKDWLAQKSGQLAVTSPTTEGTVPSNNRSISYGQTAQIPPPQPPEN